MRLRSLLLLALVLCPAPAWSAEDAGIVWRDDFEQEDGIANRWSAVAKGKITATRKPAAPADAPAASGRVLAIESDGTALLTTKSFAPRGRLADCETLRLSINPVSATEQAPVVMEVQFHDSRARRWFWRKYTFQKPGWQRLDVPLRFMRPGANRLAEWESIDQLALRLETPASTLVDQLELVDASPLTARLAPEELFTLAFGDGAKAKIFKEGSFAILTDHPDLDGPAVLKALGAMRQRLDRDLPGLGEPRRPVVLIVFADAKQYRAFWPRFGRAFNSVAPEPKADGFTALGIATTSYSDRYGKVRPTYVHETTHALTEQLLGFGNASEWLHESLGNWYGMEYSGQELPALAKQALATGQRLAFDDLLDGEPIPMESYWQAVLVLRWLTEDPAMRPKFLAALEDIRRNGSSDLRPLAQPRFSATLEDLDRRWLEWARAKYAN